MRIATWNVNSVRQRLDHLLAFLTQAKPDALCLQEIKCVDEAFPHAEVEAAGYRVATHGQKIFNGVAILSKMPLEDVRRGLPGDEADGQARYLEGVLSRDDGAIRIASIYLPNGNPTVSEKYPYKLAWMERLIAHAKTLLTFEEPLVLAGDYNIIPEPRDVRHPKAWLEDALFLPSSRAKWRELLQLGLTDALRACSDAAELYTFWDYQAGAFAKNNGIRIDHLLVSPQALDGLQNITIHKEMRGWEKPSDHVPVSGDFVRSGLQF